MRKRLSIIITALILAISIGTVTLAETDVYHVQEPQDPGEYALDPGTLVQDRQEIWEQYRQSALDDEVLQETTGVRGDPNYQFEAEITFHE